MCGLVGIIQTNNKGIQKDLEKFFRCALIIDQLRGEDSTGMYMVPRAKNIKKYSCDPIMFKRACNAMDFLNNSMVKKLLNNMYDMQYIIGHNRWATMGDITNKSAHPFQCEHITLVHNGTIRHFGKYDAQASLYNVDSAALCVLFAEKGFKETLEEVVGAYAVIWHDARDNSLNFIRNDERPLLMGSTDFGYVLGSEEWMIKAAVDYSTIKLEEIINVPEYKHYKITPQFDDKILSFVEEETDLSEDLDCSTGYGNYGNYYNNFTNNHKNNNVHILPKGKPETSQEILNKVGVDVGVNLEFVIDSWVPFRNSPFWGTAFGTTKYPIESYGKKVKIKFSGCPKEFIELLNDEDDSNYSLIGKVSYASMEGENAPNPHLCLCEVFADIISLSTDDLIRVRVKGVASKDDPLELQRLKIPEKNIIEEAEFREINSSEEMNYVCSLHDAGVQRFNKSGWEIASKHGCCTCSCDLEPTITNTKEKKVEHVGNAVMDAAGNLWCIDCWCDDKDNGNYQSKGLVVV